MTSEPLLLVDAFFARLSAERHAREAAMTEQERFEDMAVEFAKRGPIVDQLMTDDPRLSPISAIIIAGDLQTVERSKAWVGEGLAAREALRFVGSYGRLAFALWAVDEGHEPEDWLLDQLPELWSGADPDDTDPRFLDLWRKAWVQNGRRTVRDGKHLPKGRQLRCFRGQDAEAPLGIAWSLDPKIAEKFARGAGTRQADRDGRVFETLVPRAAVLAFLTGRGESEVILPTIGTDYRSVIRDVAK